MGTEGVRSKRLENHIIFANLTFRIHSSWLFLVQGFIEKFMEENEKTNRMVKEYEITRLNFISLSQSRHIS